MQPGRRSPHLFFLFLLISFAGFSQQKNIGIRIVQEDIGYSPDNEMSTVTLERKGFKIQVLLQNVRGVYVYASLSDSVFRLPDDMPVPGFRILPDLLVREEENNKEKELVINDAGWCLWSSGPGSSSCGFNKKIISLDSGRVVGTKTIKQLYFPLTRKTIKLKDNFAPLFLLFMAVDEWDENGKPVKELIRKRVKIDWLDED